MTVTYMLKGAKHTDKERILINVFDIKQIAAGVLVFFNDDKNDFICIENGIEFHVMPEEIK